MSVLDIFVDESGNTGKMGRYFTLAFLVCENGTAKKIRRCLRKKSKQIKDCHPLKKWKHNEVKAANVSKSERHDVLDSISHCGVHIHYVVVDKRLTAPKMLTHQGIAYNYWIKIVIDDIIVHFPSTKSINLFIDRRSIKSGSLNSLKEYLTIHLLYEQHRDQLKVTVQYPESHTDYGIQAVDFVANAINQHYLSGRTDLISAITHIIHYPVQHFPPREFDF